MRLETYNLLTRHAATFFAPRSSETVPDWCCNRIYFDEPKNSGPYKLTGYEYIREMLDWWGDNQLSDGVTVSGAQIGKTAMIMAGVSWKAVNDPDRFLWVMPSRDKCAEFSRTRLHPMWRRSEVTRELIPQGRLRHDFSTFHMRLGSSQIDMAWSGSPTALSSNPCGCVVLDEVDKFPPGNKEANPVALAEQRTKKSATPKRMKTSTPTIPEGSIWQEFLKTDQRRWFVPCPHCSKFVVLVWSKTFTIFKLTGCEAGVVWDKDAKHADGTWDLDKVEASARAECPHCGGHIRDGHKTQMNRGGEWRPTAPAARGYRGWHLPSLYSVAPECNFGRLARKFLQQKQSLIGLQDFINSDLAEPYVTQDMAGEHLGTITTQIDITAEWRKILSADVQEDQIFFIYRAWNGGNSKGLVAGTVPDFEGLRLVQLGNQIPDCGVIIDSGWDTKEVYRQCARFCKPVETPQGGKPVLVGWFPSKGMPIDKLWKSKKTGELVPWNVAVRDPYIGTTNADLVTIGLFEFSSDWFKDNVLMPLRSGRAGFKWELCKGGPVYPGCGPELVNFMAHQEYERHMKGEYKRPKLNRFTNRVEEKWVRRPGNWPNHWFDCENINAAYAVYQGLFSPSAVETLKDS